MQPVSSYARFVSVRLSHQVMDLALTQAIARYLGAGQNSKKFFRFVDACVCAKVCSLCNEICRNRKFTT